MNILFLSHYFPPEVNAPASRTFEHCREWVRAGHAVTVVTCVPNHPHGRIFAGYRNRLYQSEVRDGIRVVRLLTYATANEGTLRRTANYVIYMLMAMAAARFLPRPDIVISTSPQFFNGLAGFFVGRMRRCPWVLEIRDLWPESILAVGAIGNARVIAALEWLEAFAYRRADAIVSVTESFVAHIEAKGGRGKASVIRNGVDLGLFQQRAYNDEMAAALGLRGRFVAAYVGTHGMAHGLGAVLAAARKLHDRSDITFLLVGDGAEKQELLARREAMGLTNVVMLDQLPKERMPDLWSTCAVSLVLLRKADLFDQVIPSKIFESMAMGKPIILGVRGESLQIIEEAGAGIGIEPENADELADAVRRLADDRELYARLAAAGPGYVAAKFDQRDLAHRFLSLLMRVASGAVAKTDPAAAA